MSPPAQHYFIVKDQMFGSGLEKVFMGASFAVTSFRRGVPVSSEATTSQAGGVTVSRTPGL